MTYPLTTTLNRIWACDPCDTAKRRALKAAGKGAPDDEPITYQQIIEAVGLEDALWCCRAEPQYSKEWRLFGVWCARQVQHLISDQRSIDALDVAERYARGQATDEELDAAWVTARRAAIATGGAAGRHVLLSSEGNDAVAARAAKHAARAAGHAAQAIASEVPCDASWAVAWAVDWGAWAGARVAQRVAFIQLVTTGTLPELVRQEVAE